MTYMKKPEDDRNVIFEDDIWVGFNVVILKGVRIGRGAVVAAGAVVTENVLPYTIVGGVPAKIISIRLGNIETIHKHEKLLYPVEKCLSSDTLQQIADYADKALGKTC